MATRLVVGGVYQKRLNGCTLFGTMTCATRRANGFAEGLIVTNGWPPERVVDGSRELDAWELLAEPTPSDVLRRLEEQAVAASALLERIQALEAAPQPPEPTSAPANVEAFDPAKAVAAVRRRQV